MKSWLEDLIDKHLTSYIREERSITHFHPSWAGKCPRLIQLMMSGVLKESSDITARTQRIFDTGTDMHDRYGRYFEKMGVLVGKELDLDYERDGIIIKGNADYTIKDEFGNIHLLELKSMNNRRFNELWLANEPIPENFLQWNIYSKCLNIPIGELLYENKDDCNIKIFSLKYDENKFNEVFNIFKTISEYSKKDLLFPIYSKCDQKYCPAKGFCKEEFKK
jgi:hypothetical protein